MLLESGETELAKDFVIAANYLAITGDANTENVMVKILLTELDVLFSKNRDRYQKTTAAKRESRKAELELERIAELANDGWRQIDIANELDITQGAVSKRMMTIREEYPELLLDAEEGYSESGNIPQQQGIFQEEEYSNHSNHSSNENGNVKVNENAYGNAYANEDVYAYAYEKAYAYEDEKAEANNTVGGAVKRGAVGGTAKPRSNGKSKRLPSNVIRNLEHLYHEGSGFSITIQDKPYSSLDEAIESNDGCMAWVFDGAKLNAMRNIWNNA